MNKPTLVVLAAGMGSRYGSLKQMDGVGPSGEAILDYSVYDAIRAGFGRVVFVIRHSFADEFKEVFNKARFAGQIEVDYVYQELDYLPAGMCVPEGRTKPWGTNHAVMMAAKAVDGPFAAINADDFYGADAYAKMGDFLREAYVGEYCMVGYRLVNTLSENGTVSRGECTVDKDGYLVSMVERTAIGRKGDEIVYTLDGEDHPIAPETIVSMNFFGFTPDYFMHSYDYFPEFLRAAEGNLKAEFYIPTMVNKLIGEGTAKMRVLDTTAEWFGVTYKEDKPAVEARIRELVGQGIYPEKLWK
jgi:NDP-sugar pyrophosphorylase family protein